MSGPDVVDTEAPSPPWRHRDEGGRHFLQRLSDRTPLRTKLITAVLALVIMALAVISVVSVVIVRSNLYTQRDTQLEDAFSHVLSAYQPPRRQSLQVNTVLPYPYGGGIVHGLQQLGSQVSRRQHRQHSSRTWTFADDAVRSPAADWPVGWIRTTRY